MTTHYVVQGFELTNDLERYTKRKLARLNRKIPRKARIDAACDITFSRTKHNEGRIESCTLLLRLPTVTFTAKEVTQHMHAALDIAIVQIERQLEEYERSWHS
jgi:ribosomal subunit interface protein